jgi:hypothetical protein
MIAPGKQASPVTPSAQYAPILRPRKAIHQPVAAIGQSQHPTSWTTDPTPSKKGNTPEKI